MTGRVVILGGGVTGLAMARMLEPYFDDIVIVERNSKLGGLCMSESFDGVYVDICGGHIFNTNDNGVRDFVFSIMPKSRWVKSDRNAKIFIDEKFIGFPFENHMFQLGEDFARKCIGEMKEWAGARAMCETSWKNYLLTSFGPTACEKYFFPYNEKIWQYPLDKISANWVNRKKIPMHITVEQVEEANQRGGAKDEGMTHASFYYPRHGGIESFLEELFPSSANIFTGCRLQKLKWDTAVKAWQLILDGYDGEMVEMHADFVVNTTPVNQFLHAMGIDFPPLPYHGTDILVCITDFFTRNKEVSWAYFPEKKYWWHKMSHLAYLTSDPRSHAHVLVDAPGGSTLNQTKLHIPGYHVTTQAVYQHAMTYPIEPTKSVANTEKLHVLLSNLRESGAFSIGRWGRHRYANMDVCIRDALDAKKEIVASL
jgi:UDP-galactopyranose mutase